MKQVTFFAILLSVVLFSCTKQSSTETVPASLDGTWRMVMVKDNSSGIASTKPSDVAGNVDITFTSTNGAAGTLRGLTPTNQISESAYLTGTNQLLRVPVLAMTKVAETAWGKEFVDNIRDAQQYSFENDGKLAINTIQKTLIFQKQ